VHGIKDCNGIFGSFNVSFFIVRVTIAVKFH
jgi:hypothetical protein